MLRMIQSQSADQAKEYHTEELTQSGYYLDDQELKGSFHGKVARRLGIAGEVDKKFFDALCDNLHPVSFKKLTPRTALNRTVGYDINFHCPKSVSVLHVLSKDDHILEAFRRSVHATMQDIETDMLTRVRKGGKDEDRLTGELLWADFLHQTARPVKGEEPDPHLHCHCYTFNVTWDETEQQYKAGQFRDIKRDMPYYEARFHKRLSDELIGLGYRIRRTGKFFEVEGVPQPVIDLFSKRTNEIGQIARQEGITDARELDQLGARTRVKKKKHLTMTELKKEWRRQIYALGMEGDGKSGDPIRYGKFAKGSKAQPGDCIDHALLHRFERASVVHARRLLETAYRFGIGNSAVTLESMTEAFRQDGRIIQVQDGLKVLCTTREVLEEERRMVELAQAGKGKLVPLYNIVPPLIVTGDQAEAVTHALTTTDRVAIIRGGAGTGKTTTMKELVSLIHEAGMKTTLVAPTANASRGVLRQEGFEQADTVAMLLTDSRMQEGLANGCLIVDEAGLLGVKDLSALLQLATDKNCRLILCGDTRQHSSVIRGDALRILNTLAGIKAAEVNKIYRQRHEVYRKAVEELATGNVKAVFELLDSFGAIKEISRHDKYGQLVADYREAVNRGKTVLVVSPTHKQGEAVTVEIRHALKEDGRIKSEETTVTRYVNLNMTNAEKSETRHYRPGHVIQFNKKLSGIPSGSLWKVKETSGGVVMLAGEDDKVIPLTLGKPESFTAYRETSMQLAVNDSIVITRNSFDLEGKRLNNGQRLKVASIDKDGNVLFKNEAGKVSYSLGKNFGHITYGYVATSHGSQGRTVDEVFIAQPADTFPGTDMKQFYVSVSRARDKVHIYTDDKVALLDHATDTGDRQSAVELIGINPIGFVMARNRDETQKQPQPTPAPHITNQSQTPGIHAPKPAKLTL